MFRSALLILSGNLTGYLFLFLRNLLVARLIGVADYGIASTFLLSMSIVEMMSALGIQQQLILRKDGDDADLQAALQGVQALRAVLNAGALLLLAGPIAAFLGVPQVTWAYRLLALMPLFNGLQHLDTIRQARRMVYLPGIISNVLPVALSVLCVWPLAMLTGDYRVLLFAMLIQGAAALVGTHLLAARRYRLRFDRAVMRESLRFGWPLMLDGVILFAVFNGEKLIVGHQLGMAALALFSMGFTLTLTPTLMLGNTGANFFLPQLSAAPDTAQFEPLAAATLQLHFLFGGLTLLGVMLFGPPFVHLALGAKYAALPPLLIWLAILQGLRVLKGGSSIVALARGQTGNALASNLIRIALLPVAWVATAQGGSMLTVIHIGIVGEFGGFIVALWLVQRRLRLPLRPLLPSILLTLATFALAAVYALRASGEATGDTLNAALLGFVALLFALSFLGMRDLRGYIARRTLTRHEA
ncbi:MAG: oligosaccharide flippase family protein [Rhodobacteraceae bacterium]|nr:oligosaccharide flippase family protein [Paracoccaceae bacterium]